MGELIEVMVAVGLVELVVLVVLVCLVGLVIVVGLGADNALRTEER